MTGLEGKRFSVDKMKELLIAFALLVGLIVSYFDIKTQRVPNKAIAVLLVVGALFQFLSGSNFFSVGIVLLYAFFISFLIWWLGIWPAGDAKLFFAFFLFFPFKLISNPSIVTVFFINTFVPVSFFMVLIIIIKSKFKLLKDAFKYSFVPYNVFMIAVILLGFVWFVMRPLGSLGLYTDYFFSLIILFFAFELLKAFFTFKMELFFLILAIVRVVIDFRTVYTLSFLFNFLMLAALFIFFRFFVLFLSYNLYTKKVPLSRLKAGMSPAEFIVSKKRGFERVSFLQSSFIGYLSFAKEKPLHNLDCLSKEDVKKIKTLRKSKKIPFSTLRVGERQAFCPFYCSRICPHHSLLG